MAWCVREKSLFFAICPELWLGMERHFLKCRALHQLVPSFDWEWSSVFFEMSHFASTCPEVWAWCFALRASFAEICSGQVAKKRDFLDLYAVTALRWTFARVCPRDKLHKRVTFSKMVTRERFNWWGIFRKARETCLYTWAFVTMSKKAKGVILPASLLAPARMRAVMCESYRAQTCVSSLPEQQEKLRKLRKR